MKIFEGIVPNFSFTFLVSSKKGLVNRFFSGFFSGAKTWKSDSGMLKDAKGTIEWRIIILLHVQER
jgi:hypothetical protein